MIKLLDLCKIFGVEEGEEFKINGKDTIYFITDNISQYKINSYHSEVSNLKVNEIIKITKLPKKKQFSQDTLNFFKYIDKKFEWIAKDKDGEVWIFIDKPKKSNVSWANFGSYKPLDVIKNSLFTEIKWEDEEPIYIDDYVNR